MFRGGPGKLWGCCGNDVFKMWTASHHTPQNTENIVHPYGRKKVELHEGTCCGGFGSGVPIVASIIFYASFYRGPTIVTH